MNDEAIEVQQTATDALTGITGLGPVRRRLLTEAGITTPAALATATIEQIIAVTGMPRAAAEQVHALALAKSPPVENASAPIIATDTEIAEIVELPNDTEPKPELTRLERSTLRAHTAIADASRHASRNSKLAAALLRFARLVDVLPQRLERSTRPGSVRRIAERMEEIAERLEALTGKSSSKTKSTALSSKRAKRLRQRIKRTRDSIKRTLKTSNVLAVVESDIPA